MNKLIFKICLLICIAFQIHCSSTEVGPTARATLVLPKFLLDDPISARVTIEASDLTTPIILELATVTVDANDPNQVTLAIDVPVGSNRRIGVSIFTIGSSEGFRGEATVDIPSAGTTVPIDVIFLNQIRDFPNDDIPVPPANVVPDLGEIHIILRNVASESRVQIELHFTNTNVPTETAAAFFFDTDFNELTGNRSAMTPYVGSVTVPQPLGVERVIEIIPNVADPMNPGVSVLNGDLTSFSGATTSTINAFWDNTLHVLTLNVQEAFLRQIIGSTGHFNTLVGVRISGTTTAADSALEQGVADYDLDELIIP